MLAASLSSAFHVTEDFVHRRLIAWSSLFLLASFPGHLAAQEPAPAPAPAAAKKSAAKPAAPVYDEQADARKDVAAAVARAKKENRRVLIQWGANWCGWCKWLAATMHSDEALSTKLRDEYDVVHVDVGRFDKNVELSRDLGCELKKVIEGIPFLTILDADGKPIAQQKSDDFELKVAAGDAHHDVAKLVAFLTEHQAKYLDAKDVRAAAFAQAKKDGKMVFLHFGAPWCPYCHQLDDWMAQPEIAALLAKDFVDVKIDQDRMSGGKEMLEAEAAAAGVEADGIPWFVFCDADGKQLANSNAAEGNIGFPSKPEEVAHFAKMLEKCKRNLTDTDVKTLVGSLNAIRAADEAKKKAREAGQ
jgi:thioredoxin-related protein